MKADLLRNKERTLHSEHENEEKDIATTGAYCNLEILKYGL